MSDLLGRSQLIGGAEMVIGRWKIQAQTTSSGARGMAGPRDAVYWRFRRVGATAAANTEGHDLPPVSSAEADRVMRIAQEHGALGCKSTAGGGSSITILTALDERRAPCCGY